MATKHCTMVTKAAVLPFSSHCQGNSRFLTPEKKAAFKYGTIHHHPSPRSPLSARPCSECASSLEGGELSPQDHTETQRVTSDDDDDTLFCIFALEGIQLSSYIQMRHTDELPALSREWLVGGKARAELPQTDRRTDNSLPGEEERNVIDLVISEGSNCCACLLTTTNPLLRPAIWVMGFCSQAEKVLSNPPKT